MMKTIKAKLVITVLSSVIFFSTTAFSEIIISDENCCSYIWAAGHHLGLATSHMYYTQSKPYWDDNADGLIYNNILKAGQEIENANKTCNGMPAWPNWKHKKHHLERIANSLANNPSSLNRERLAKSLWNTKGWFHPLQVVALPNRRITRPTCAEKYFRLGWWVGYIQQTLLLAEEALTVYGNEQGWHDMTSHSRNHMGTLITILNEYQNLRPISGYCAQINTREIIGWVADLRSRYSPTDITYMARDMYGLSETLHERIQNGCPLGGIRYPVPDPIYPPFPVPPPGPEPEGEDLTRHPIYSNYCPKQNPGNKLLYKFDSNSNPNDNTYLFCEYFKDGALKEQRPILNGRKHGVHIVYGTSYRNKHKHPIGRKTTFKYGVQDGITTFYTWCQDGNRVFDYKSSEVLYRNGKKVPGTRKPFPSPCAK